VSGEPDVPAEVRLVIDEEGRVPAADLVEETPLIPSVPAPEAPEGLGSAVVLQVELAGTTGVRVAPKAVRIDLGGPGRTQCSGRQVARQWPRRAREASIRAQKNALTRGRWARFWLSQ
jgi:hypothetical protein